MKFMKLLLLSLSLMLLAAPAALGWECPQSCQHCWSKVSETSATCTHRGKKVMRCNKCGAKKTKSKPALGHKWGGWTTTQEATCVQTGTQVRRCSRCKAKETRSIPVSGHNCKGWTIVTPATDHSMGVRAATCTVCGERVTEEFYPEGTLRRNDKSDEIKEFQSILACHGYLKRRRDYSGVYDSATEKAVIALQQDYGLVADGIAWPQTIALLSHDYGDWTIYSVKSDFSIGRRERICPACGHKELIEEIPSPMLQRGDRGEEVKTLQTALNDAGYNVGTVDGDYGRRTTDAVKAFERDHGLTEDGIAWPGVMMLIPGLDMSDFVVDGATLLLKVTPLDASGRDRMTFSWTLTNTGAALCDSWRIECGDASSEGRLMAAGTLPLEPNREGSNAGLFELDASTAPEALVFRAKGVDVEGASCESAEVVVSLSEKSTTSETLQERSSTSETVQERSTASETLLEKSITPEALLKFQ